MNNQLYVDIVPGKTTGVCYTPNNVDTNSIIVLLHGECFCASVWTFWVDHFLNAGYEVWCPNFPGYYGSKGEDSFIGRKIAVFELLYVIKKNNSDNLPIFLLGHGSGGLVAQSVASGMTGLAGVIMLNSLSPKGMAVTKNHLLLKQMVKHSRKILMGKEFFLTSSDASELLLNGVEREDRRDEIHREMTHASGFVTRDIIVGIDIPNLNAPSLVVSGDNDRLALWGMQKFLVDKYKSDFLHFSTGHLPMLEITESWLVDDIAIWMDEQIQ